MIGDKGDHTIQYGYFCRAESIAASFILSSSFINFEKNVEYIHSFLLITLDDFSTSRQYLEEGMKIIILITIRNQQIFFSASDYHK